MEETVVVRLEVDTGASRAWVDVVDVGGRARTVPPPSGFPIGVGNDGVVRAPSSLIPSLSKGEG